MTHTLYESEFDCETCADERYISCGCWGKPAGCVCGDCQGTGEFPCPDCNYGRAT